MLHIWALTDDKPGHQNQTAGLIQALSDYTEVHTNWLPALSFAKSLKFLLTGRCMDYCSQDKTPPDLIIGTGHKTHWALLALKRCCGGRNIVLMTPSLPLAMFDLCLIPRHDKPPIRNNVIETLGAINRVVPSNNRQTGQGLILLGGQSRHFNWATDKVIDQINRLIDKTEEQQWTIATSRRTPSDCYHAIEQRFPDAGLVSPQSVSKDWLPQKMQEAEQIWVSEDSISMIYEALTSGAQTGIIRLDKLPGNKSTRVTQEIDRLLAEHRVMTPSFSSSSHIESHHALNEADRCARLILKKFEL